MSDANKAAVRRLVQDGINTGNIDLMAESCAANYAYHGPGGRELRGPDGLRQLASTFFTALPGLQMTVDDQIAEGDTVVTRFTFRGTHTGSLDGIAPTGKEVTVTGISIMRLEGGKLVEEWESFDELGMMQQIGAISAQAEA